MSLISSFQRAVNWFMPAGHETDSRDDFRPQANVAVSLLVGNSGFPFILVFFFMQKPREGFVVLWSWVIFMGIPFLAKRGVKASTLAHLLSANYFQCHFFLCLLFGGVSAPNTMWFAATPIVSVLVGGIRHGAIWGAVAGVAVLSMYGVEVAGLVQFPSSLDAAQQLFVVATGTVGLMAAIFGSTAAFEILRSSAIKERLAAEQDLVEANEELTTLDAQKTLFFQNISHELRTPLTLILPAIDDALNARPNDKQMQMAGRNSRRLLRLVNQLLDLQKLDAGQRQLAIKPIDLSAFLTICADSFQSACATKGLDFKVRFDGSPKPDTKKPVWIEADLDALEKIVFNFLSNALKFTAAGGSIELGITPKSDRVRIYVKDTGCGIADADLHRLFKTFSQVDSGAKREYEGTGLGLALAKSLAEQLGGDVGVDSEESVGSTFWVELAQTNAQSEPQDDNFEPRDWLIDPTATSDAMPTLSMLNTLTGSKLALVVDDLVDLRKLVGGFLERAGYQTLYAPDGKAAFELALAHRPDVVITDWMMPKMTGPELITALRNRPELQTIPTVLLTAKSDEESRLAGTALGADAFLGKPFSEQELVSVVRNLVALKQRERDVERLNQELTETVLKRYLPPPLVDRILEDDMKLGEPSMRTVTVLFSDICSFSQTSEDLGAAAISKLLNAYLTKMTEVIFEHGGTIDKFIGDGIMVMFGAPVDQSPEDQAIKAAACAVAMQTAMTDFAHVSDAMGLPRLEIRIGIHQGDAVVGNFGSSQRLDYTCIGPMVNIAARIEGHAPRGGVMVSEAIIKHLDPAQVTAAGRFKLRGMQTELPLFLIGDQKDQPAKIEMVTDS